MNDKWTMKGPRPPSFRVYYIVTHVIALTIIMNPCAGNTIFNNPEVGVVGLLQDAYMPGGYLQEDLTDYDTCIETCERDSRCLGVDFHFDTKQCHFHDPETACQPALARYGSQHVQIAICSKNTHRQGAELTVLSSLDASITDCVRMCRETSVCVAVDWDESSATCWLHRQASACSQLIKARNVTHISKVSCHGIPTAVEVSYGYFLQGGTLSSDHVSEESCTSACASDENCWTASFDIVNNNCYLHGRTSGCLTRIPQAGTVTRRYRPCEQEPPRVYDLADGVILTAEGSLGTIHSIGQSLQTCVDSCKPPCTACNFRTIELQFNECWHITGVTEGCYSATPRAGFTVYRLNNCTNPNRFLGVERNFHVRGGQFMSVYTTEGDCVAACRAPGCQAVDYNAQEQACFHHTLETQSACNVLVTKELCNHYTLIRCEATRRVIARFDQMRIRGTKPRILTALTSSECLQACAEDTSCYAIDYSTAPSMSINNCHLHSREDSCRVLTPDLNWFNFRFTDCDSVFPGSRNFTGKCGRNGRVLYGTHTAEACYKYCLDRFGSSPPCQAVDFDADTRRCYVHGTATACTPLVENPTCTHYRIAECQSHQDSYIKGGAVVDGVTDAFNCVVMCYLLGNCIAVDFNTATDRCFLHNATTGCGPLTRDFTAVNFIHYKFVDCPNSSPTIGKTYFGQQVSGGTQVMGVYDPNSCLKDCFSSYPQCRAADYDFRDKTCWFHNDTSACHSPLAENNVIHYRMDNCETNEQPFSVLGLNQSQPYQLTGYRIEGGSVSQTPVDNIRQCMAVCEDVPGCNAADWNAITKTCFYHVNEAACSPLIRDPEFVHLSLTYCDGYFARVDQILQDQTLGGGIMVGTATSVDDCILSCLGPCLAVTYDTNNGACVHHHSNSHCTDPVRKTGSILYRTTSCAEFQNGNQPFTAAFVNYRSWSGSLNISGTTEEQCVRACRERGTNCTAVDYNTNSRVCTLHDNIECGPLVLDAGYIHLAVKSTCDPDVTRVKAYHGFNKHSGSRLTLRLSEEDCINVCHPQGVVTLQETFQPCFAADYDVANAECWHHHQADICDEPPSPLNWVNHYQVLGTGRCLIYKMV